MRTFKRRNSFSWGQTHRKTPPTQDNAAHNNSDESMFPAWFEPAILVSELFKVIRALDRAVTLVGSHYDYHHCNNNNNKLLINN